MSLPAHPSRRFCFGPFEADLETGELRKNGRKVRLQEKPFQVLTSLLQRSGKLVSRETLRQSLWPQDTFVDFDNGLNTAVSKLREVLGDSAEESRYIETLARRGYRFVAPVGELLLPDVAQPTQLHVRKKSVEPDMVVLEIAGKIVLGPECQRIESLITELLRENQRKIVFDIFGVTHLDSTGVGILVLCSGRIAQSGGELRVANATEIVREVLKIARVDKIVHLYPTTAAAIEDFALRDDYLSESEP